MLTVLIGALLIGLSLGVLGSGGAILTVPILAYGLGQPEKLAIAGALAVVGVISLVSSIPGIRRKKVNWSLVLLFGLPGMLGTYLGAWLALFTSGLLQMTVFSVVMVAAAWRMFKSPAANRSSHIVPVKASVLGVLVGILTGFVGVGGGFLIVPALVLLAGLGMAQAVPTSLVIITMNCAVGFAKYHQVMIENNLTLDWSVIAPMSAIGVIGSFAGQHYAKRLPQQKIKKAFGVFLCVMAGFILYRSLPGLLL